MTKEKTKHEKNVELSNMKLEQTTLVDDIVIGSSELGHKRIVLTTMIINTIKSNVVDLSYKDKATNLEYFFNDIETVSNRDVRGFVDAYKVWLGVDTLKEWENATDTGKERMRVLKDSFWVALPLIKADCLQKNKKGEQFTGSKNSEVFIEGGFAKKYSPNPVHQKGVDQHSMKFSDLKKASQNYYADKSTNLNTNEPSGVDNSFNASLKKMTRTINASKGELVLGKEQAGTENSIKALAVACNQWVQEFHIVRDSNMTPEQIAKQKKIA
jgi:hypothetical protein